MVTSTDSVQRPPHCLCNPYALPSHTKTRSLHQLPREDQQRHVRRQTEHGEQGDAVARGAELADDGDGAVGVLLGGGEELAVALVAAVDCDEHDGGAVDGEEGSDGVELGREDLEDDEGEGELREGGAHVGALKGPLGGADLDESGDG